MAEKWKCPDCPREFDPGDPLFARAVVSHLKGHGKRARFYPKDKPGHRDDAVNDAVDIAVDLSVYQAMTPTTSSSGSGSGSWLDWILPWRDSDGSGSGGGKSSGGGSFWDDLLN